MSYRHMRSFKIGRARVALCACVTAVMLALPAGSALASKAPTAPRVVTGGALHAVISSAELTAVINPEGFATSYFFQYGTVQPGTTCPFSLQTPAVSLGSGRSKIKVGQSIGGLRQGVVYCYRAVATSPGHVVPGKERTFTLTGGKPKLELTKLAQVVVGTPFVLSGTLTGLNNANQTVMLQASPFPYLEAFTTIGPPAVTNALGRFAFRVANLTGSTQFRAVTAAVNPLFSLVITVGASVKVTFHARTSGAGLVRLYGTVSPAAVGAHVSFQLEKPVRPGKKASEEEGARKFVSQFSTIVKRGTKTISRFSAIVKVRHTGRYRAYVKVRPGKLVSGYSIQTVVLHAPKAKH